MVFTGGGQPFHCIDHLCLGNAEVVDQEFGAIGASEVVEAL